MPVAFIFHNDVVVIPVKTEIQIKGDGMESNMVWDVFQIAEREGGSKQWSRIGVAFLNRDQSINVLLDAFPKDGKVQLRRRKNNNQKSEGEML